MARGKDSRQQAKKGRADAAPGVSSQEVVKGLLARETFPPVVALVSESPLRIGRLSDFLAQQLSQRAAFQAPTERIRITGPELKADRLQRLALEGQTFSLFRQLRLVLLAQAERIPAGQLEELGRFLKGIVGGDLVVFLEFSAPPQKGALKELFKEIPVVTLEPLEGPFLRQWVAAELRREGLVEVPPAVIDHIILFTDSVAERIAQCAAHLGLYSDDGRVTPEDIQRLFPAEPAPGDFVLLDHLANGAEGEALRNVRHQVTNGKGPFALIGLLARSYQEYLQLLDLRQRLGSREAVASHMRKPAWAIEKQLSRAERYSIAQLRSCHGAILRAEAKLKNVSLDAEHLLCEVVRALLVRSQRGRPDALHGRGMRA